MKSRHYHLETIGIAMALLSACSTGVVISPNPNVYDYVFGFDPVTGEFKTGGSHAIVDFSGKSEAIDYQNRADRLHPDLKKSPYLVYDPELKAGKSDVDAFPSQWWSQADNGIAYRWSGVRGDFSDHSNRDHLSPAEKYDLLFYPNQTVSVEKIEHWDMTDVRKKTDAERGPKHAHDTVTALGPTTKWELEHHGLYQAYAHPENWWGHCNGWAAYVTTERDPDPRRDIRVKLDRNKKIVECKPEEKDCVLFYKGDIEALMTELYFSDTATFSGRRCNVNPDDLERDEFGRPKNPECRDINPGAFHVAVVGMFSRGVTDINTKEAGRKPAFVIDHNYDWEVWNFPIVSYEILEQEEVTAAVASQLVGKEGAEDYAFNPNAKKFVRIRMNYHMISDGVPHSELHRHAKERAIDTERVELNYVLELDDRNQIVGGEWIKRPVVTWGENSKELHPDFMWMAVNHRGYGESDDDRDGDKDNPFVSYAAVRALLDCANKPETCVSTDVTPVTPIPTPTPEGDLFSDDMERDTIAWEATGLWHRVTNGTCTSPSANSGTSAWYFGLDTTCNYETDGQATGALASPLVKDISTTSQLFFSHTREVEFASDGGYDSTRVEVQIDGTNEWKTLWQQDSQTASTKTWQPVGPLGLGDYAGKSIRVRFRFDSGDAFSNTYLGWMIDDVRISR